MKLSRASTYALRAVVHLAARGDTTPLASQRIAEKEGIPERFLLKVLKPLVTAGVLRSLKGPNGGYRLARAAAKISVLEIIEAVDGPIRAQVPSFSAGGTAVALNRKLETLCAEAATQLRQTLQKTRVTDFSAKSGKKAT